MSKNKEKESLNPEIVESEPIEIDKGELMKVAENLQNAVVIPQQEDTADNFFRGLVKSLDSPDTISTNTEYLSIPENFTGTKLEFLSQFAYMPFLKNFVAIFETKRVSLQRKGRIEKIKAIQERQQELKMERLQNFSRLFDIG